MNSGLIQKWDKLEWKITLSASHNRDADDVEAVLGDVPETKAEADLTSWYDLNGVKELGIRLGIRAVDSDSVGSPIFGATRTEAYLEIPNYPSGAISATYSISSTFEHSDHDTELVFTDCWLYQDFQGWLLKWSELEWFVDSVSVDTYGSGELTGNLKPASVPLFGVPPRIAAGAFLNVSPPSETFEDCGWTDNGFHENTVIDASGGNLLFPPYYKIAEVSTAASGGWRVKQGDDYWTFPVSLDPLALPSSSCGPSFDFPGASSTYGGSASAYVYNEDSQSVENPNWQDPSNTTFEYEVIRQIRHYESSACEVMLLPDLTKGMLRFVDNDYAALIAVGAFPEATAVSDSGCCKKSRAGTCESVVDDSDDPAAVTDTVFPETDYHLCRITNSTHDAESIFSIPSYAPYSATGRRNYSSEITKRLRHPGSIPIGGGSPDNCYESDVNFERSEARSVYPDNLSDPSDAWQELWHNDALDDAQHDIRYINYCVHPHWSFFYYFPNDDDTDYWKINGTKESSQYYWIPIGEQWFQHDDIDTGDDTETRNFLISAPIVGSLPNGVTTYYLGDGAPSSWWGCCRFRSDTTEPIASKTLSNSSSGLWSASSATLSHGANITVNPSALTGTVDLDLGSFTAEGYMYPHIANLFTVGWSGAHLTDMEVRLVTPEGDEVVLATAAGTYPRTVGDESKYAGSWAQDRDLGMFTSDLGVDTEAAGISSTVMSSAERVFAFSLLHTRTAGKLRFAWTVDDHSADFTINYPTMAVSEDDATLIQENAKAVDIIWPNGPGVRWGVWWALDDNTFEVQTPEVMPFDIWPSVLDWLVYRNLVLLAQDKETNLNTDIEALYDAQELLVSGDDVRWQAAISTKVFLVPGGRCGIAILMNCEAEVPPLACWPMHDRDTDYTLIEDMNNFVQVAYSHAQEMRYIVSGGGYLHLFDPSPVEQWTSVSTISVADWFISQHSRAVDNNEMDDFEIRCDGDTIATASPWHGYFGTCMVMEDMMSSWVCHCRDYTDRLFLFLVGADGTLITLAFDDLDDTYITYEIDSDTDCTHPQYYLYGDMLIGTHLASGTARIGRTYKHGIEWELEDITDARPYSALTSAAGIDRVVVLGFDSGWYVQVGEVAVGGTISWSTPVAVSGLSSPDEKGWLRYREDGSLEFYYLTTSGAARIARCYAVDVAAAGTWTDEAIANGITYDNLTFAQHVDRPVLIAHHTNGGGGDTDATGWYVQVGTVDSDGSLTWSDPVEITGLTDPAEFSWLEARDDGVLEWVYLQTDGTPHMARCYALDLSADGDWA